MQLLSLLKNSKLVDLANIVGDRNVEYVLASNGLTRSVDIGDQFNELCRNTIQSNDYITPQRKKTILNRLVSDSDIFEYTSLLSEDNWKIMSVQNTLPQYLYIPESIELPRSADTLGNGVHIDSVVYNDVIAMLSTEPYTVDPSVFNEYSTIKNSKFINSGQLNNDISYWFPLPIGNVTLYSSLLGESIDIPAYPEELEDSRKANYTEMPELLYQYEPWYVYQSSGPRSVPYRWGTLHRDMWSGDHNDGKANELIRFCESCCYPNYQGAAVYNDIVTLYINGKNLITGIMTDVSVKWSGPLLKDGWYAQFSLEFTINEVSPIPLNNSAIRQKPLIG